MLPPGEAVIESMISFVCSWKKSVAPFGFELVTSILVTSFLVLLLKVSYTDNTKAIKPLNKSSR